MGKVRNCIYRFHQLSSMRIEGVKQQFCSSVSCFFLCRLLTVNLRLHEQRSVVSTDTSRQSPTAATKEFLISKHTRIQNPTLARALPDSWLRWSAYSHAMCNDIDLAASCRSSAKHLAFSLFVHRCRRRSSSGAAAYDCHVRAR